MTNPILDILQNQQLTYRQQVMALAQYAESLDHTIEISDELAKAIEDGCIDDLGEGNAPYRPRYICPNYQQLMDKGSEFLGLEPASNLAEALNNLLIMYNHVPSITSYPVYIGDWDTLLEPFVLKEDREVAKNMIRLFMLNVDRTVTDSFVHANIGPHDTLAGRIILELTEELELAVPNITVRYDKDVTPREFAELCATCMLKTAKPSFANHKMFVSEWGEHYAIASCYNGLEIGGGGFTLPRFKLRGVALKAKDQADFFENVLPYYANLMLKMMDDRIEFLVEHTNFFTSNFLVKEGFISLDHFGGMFGVIGLAEAANILSGVEDRKQGFGNNKEVDDLGVKIMDALTEIVNAHTTKYCASCGHKYRLHAQVGIGADGMLETPGARIPVGAEPIMPKQIMHSERFHKYFPTGVGDIFQFEETWLNTPGAVVDIVSGAFDQGMRFFSGYLCNTDVVRVTGYLVKKSELAKLDRGEQSINTCSFFGQEARDEGHALSRRLQEK